MKDIFKSQTKYKVIKSLKRELKKVNENKTVLLAYKQSENVYKPRVCQNEVIKIKRYEFYIFVY